MRINIITAMHGRPEVSRIFLESLRMNQDNNEQVELKVFAAVSDDGSADVCSDYDVDFIRCENKPLGNKWNEAAYLAASYDCDYFMITGDDDLYSDEYFKGDNHYAMLMGVPHFGTDQIYFYSPHDDKASLFKYNSQRLIGAGRFISERAFGRIGLSVKFKRWIPFLSKALPDSQPGNTVSMMSLEEAEYLQSSNYGMILDSPKFQVWDEIINKGLDGCIESRLVRNGAMPEKIKSDLPQIVDLKTGKNIWGFEKMSTLGTEVGTDQATAFLPKKIKKMISELPGYAVH